MKSLKDITVKFNNWNCKIVRHTYRDEDQNALALVDCNDGSPIATATVCIPGTPLESDEVIIKDYSENAGMLVALIASKAIGEPIRFAMAGFETVPICKLLAF